MKRIFILGLLATLLSGCATILQSGPDKVMVSTEPSGARIKIDGIPVGHSPMLVPINRSSEGVFTIEKDGYETATIDRDKVLAGWVFGNILLGGVIGLGVDLITHNQGKYTEDPIFLQLAPVNATDASPKVSMACERP